MYVVRNARCDVELCMCLLVKLHAREAFGSLWREAFGAKPVARGVKKVATSDRISGCDRETGRRDEVYQFPARVA